MEQTSLPFPRSRRRTAAAAAAAATRTTTGIIVAAAALLAGSTTPAGVVAASSSSSSSTDNTKPLLTDAQCDCFLTNGSSPGYYSNHMFFDFRSLPQYAPPRGADAPPLVLNESQAAIAPVTSAYFGGTLWNSTWQIQGWDNRNTEGHGLAGTSTVLMVNSQSNIFIQSNADHDAASQTYMSMRTKRLPGFQTTAAFQSRSADFQFLSIRALARTIGSSGAVTAMFTYRETTPSGSGSGSDPQATVQEADLEVLTRAPRENVQYTNQPGFSPDGSRNARASLNATLPDPLLWSDWAVHRLDWTPTSSIWFVNGLQTANISVQVPRGPSSLNFNAWSDGGPWSGNMSLYDEARLEIQWIEVVYNTSTTTAAAPHRRSINDDNDNDNDDDDNDDDRRHHHHQIGPRGRLARRKGHNPGCKVVCTVDQSPEQGRPALLWNSTATAARTIGANLKASSLAWLWFLMLGSTLCLHLI